MNSVQRYPRVLSLLAFSLLVAVFAAPTAQAQEGSLCAGVAVTVDLNLGQIPTDGDDVILGTPGDDVIAAGAGDDLVCGWLGNDAIWGQAGNDVLLGEEGDDKLRGGPGDDIIDGWEGADDLAGGSGVDEVYGGPGNDVAVRGGTGDDTVNAGPGDDPLVAGNGGEDFVWGGFGDDKVTGGPRPDVVIGWWGNDEVKGNGGADFLDGFFGNDILRGGAQPDDMLGGAGADECIGGTTGEGAAEADQASAGCETVRSSEGASPNWFTGDPYGRIIGEGNVGGALIDWFGYVDPVGWELVNPTELLVYVDTVPGCSGVDSTATAFSSPDGGEVVDVLLYLGATGFLPDDQCGDPVTSTLRITLDQPVEPSQLFVGDPFPDEPAMETSRSVGRRSNGAAMHYYLSTQRLSAG